MYLKENDEMPEYCGVFGIYAPGEDVSKLAYYGLFALQHRGQEACGIAVKNRNEDFIAFHKGKGLVTEVFYENDLARLKGDIAIGHVLYSAGDHKQDSDIQPVVAKHYHGDIACVHNGSLTNRERLRNRLSMTGAVFQSDTDVEIFINLIARHSQNNIEDAILKTMLDIEGTYAFVLQCGNALYATRDPFGNRPLCIGRYKSGYVIASESCALDTIGATFIRDVEPGEVIKIDENGLQSFQHLKKEEKAHCIFEYVYFARPDSTIDGVNVNQSRRQMGMNLAKEIEKLDCDIVISVPDSGNSAALGFSETLNIPFTQGILKNRYAGRTFIQPTQEMRELMVNLKLNPIRDELEGKSVAVIDDSVVRGTTSKRLVAKLRERGAKEIHFLVACPPVTHPCYYGIDTADKSQLIASKMSVDKICEYINADSLHYLSQEGLIDAVQTDGAFCTACLDGKYCAGTPDMLTKEE